MQAGHRPAPLLGQLVRVAGGGVGQHAGDAFDRAGQQPRQQRRQGEDDHPGGRVELEAGDGGGAEHDHGQVGHERAGRAEQQHHEQAAGDHVQDPAGQVRADHHADADEQAGDQPEPEQQPGGQHGGVGGGRERGGGRGRGERAEPGGGAVPGAALDVGVDRVPGVLDGGAVLGFGGGDDVAGRAGFVAAAADLLVVLVGAPHRAGRRVLLDLGQVGEFEVDGLPVQEPGTHGAGPDPEFIELHGLADDIEAVIGRDPSQPELLKPLPHSLISARAARHTTARGRVRRRLDRATSRQATPPGAACHRLREQARQGTSAARCRRRCHHHSHGGPWRAVRRGAADAVRTFSTHSPGPCHPATAGAGVSRRINAGQEIKRQMPGPGSPPASCRDTLATWRLISVAEPFGM